jgi:hypothetical protein
LPHNQHPAWRYEQRHLTFNNNKTWDAKSQHARRILQSLRPLRWCVELHRQLLHQVRPEGLWVAERDALQQVPVSARVATPAFKQATQSDNCGLWPATRQQQTPMLSNVCT